MGSDLFYSRREEQRPPIDPIVGKEPGGSAERISGLSRKGFRPFVIFGPRLLIFGVHTVTVDWVTALLSQDGGTGVSPGTQTGLAVPGLGSDSSKGI